MKVNLWVLITIDNGYRILYTAFSEQLCEYAKAQFPNIKNLKVINLKGELNV